MTCPLCQSSNYKFRFTTNQFHGHYIKTKDYFKYYQCNKCLSIFSDISKTNLTDFYTKNYRQKSSILERVFTKINFVQLYLLIFTQFKFRRISVLDVGCGTGEFLDKLPHYYSKTGIDIKINDPNSKLIQSDFLKYKFAHKYDLITFNHSLEHLVNPIKAITKAKSLLNHDGVVIISIPVSDSYSFKLNPQKAFHLDPPRHIFIPDSKKLKKILLKYFSKVAVLVFPFEFPLDLFWTLKNKHKYLLPIFPILKIFKSETKLFICRQ